VRHQHQANHFLPLINYTPPVISYGCQKRQLILNVKSEVPTKLKNQQQKVKNPG